MKIGLMNLGHVDAVCNHAVKTRFFVCGLPIFPLKSFMMHDDEVVCEIPLHLKSIFYGYTRIYMASAMFVMLAQFFIFDETSNPFPMLICCFIWVLTIVGGNLSTRNKLMCEAMGMTCELYLHPRYMYRSMVSQYLDKMESVWEVHKTMWNADDWREFSSQEPGDLKGALFITLLVLSLLDHQIEATAETQKRVDHYYNLVLNSYTAGSVKTP